MIQVVHLKIDPSGEILGDCPSLSNAQLVMMFGTGPIVTSKDCIETCSKVFPNAILVGCSTAGSIQEQTAFDDSIAVTALQFEHTRVEVQMEDSQSGSFEAGVALAKELLAPDLVHVLILSEGIHVNGTELSLGLTTNLPETVSVTGGLAGDGERMLETFVISGGEAHTQKVLGIGFYGSSLEVGHGCMGGWGTMGPEREITKSSGTVLHELDGQPALALYRRYLGEYSQGLPATGLLFPLQIRSPEGGPSVVRTLLGIDEDEDTVRFAGDLPEGHLARLMTASFGRLIEGAQGAAEKTKECTSELPDFAFLVSCVGRRMLLRQRSDEELERVSLALGDVPISGFYSYGELCPSGVRGCELHNQTMTVTTFKEN